MNGLDLHRSQDHQPSSTKRKPWQEMTIINRPPVLHHHHNHHPAMFEASGNYLLEHPKAAVTSGGWLNLEEDDLVSSVVPPVTVVLEGRSICQRISLDKHGSYHSMAKSLRRMFVNGSTGVCNSEDDEINLSNAIPGHLIAYEDFENDLLLAGDLNWKDFIRVAKRIRILPMNKKKFKNQKIM